jgi:two-component system, OmpR family, response regulator VicR
MKDGVPMAKRILIVDDDRAIADLLTQALSAEGYETSETTQSLRFYDAVREHQPDLILLDMLMPYLNGDDELQLMQMDPEIERPPVIVVTAHPEVTRNEQELRRLGVVDIVIKPFDLNALVRLVRQTIGEPQGVAR